MRFFYLSLLVVFTLVSCKSKARVVTTKKEARKYHTTVSRPKKKTPPKAKVTVPKTTTSTKVNHTSEKIIKKALSFKGTRYKTGGTTRSGMDCSGLVYTSFKSVNITLPRRSIDQSSKGKKIPVSKISKGDLVFFKTGRKNRINHVGLVVSIKGGEVKFIHSSSSRGVMVSSLREGYWKKAFVLARRVL